MTSTAVPAARVRRAARRKALHPRRVTLHVFLAVTALVWIAPVAWAVFTAFRPYTDTFTHGYVSWPESLSLTNYRTAWSAGFNGSSWFPNSKKEITAKEFLIPSMRT